jgi:ubiquinone/menaquinone biosynthesis C-methylase UbiE
MTNDDDMVEVYELLDKFMEKCNLISEKHPYIVIILMHEYFRNIWPNDSFIEEKLSDDKLECIILCLKNCIDIIESIKNVGSYFSPEMFRNMLKKFEKESNKEDGLTQTVYGNLWDNLDNTYLINESKYVLENIFEKNDISINEIKGKTVLDMGCGSGRFTIGFAQLGAKMVTGVDLGATGIEIGRKTSEELGLENIKFIKNNVLTLPFEDESFDFVFSKGVLHHTGDLENGLNEFHRVMKKGGKGYLYLYGSGGLFWHSRTKMREVMKKIPMNYTLRVLDIVGMPQKRYVFADSWYVPIEEHVSRKYLEEFLSSKFSKIQKVENTGDLNVNSMSNIPYSNELWGDGELRYFITK